MECQGKSLKGSFTLLNSGKSEKESQVSRNFFSKTVLGGISHGEKNHWQSGQDL